MPKPKRKYLSNLSLRGKLALDPELGFGKGGGVAYCRLSVVYTNYPVGHPKFAPMFLRFTAFRELAEMIAQCYSKGDWIHILRSRLDPQVKKCRKCPQEYYTTGFIIDEVDTTDVTDLPGDAVGEEELYREEDPHDADEE